MTPGDDADVDDKEALRRYARVDARLRRLCERKPSQRMNVPEQIHQAWSAGGTSRDELRKVLQDVDFDKDGGWGVCCV